MTIMVFFPSTTFLQIVDFAIVLAFCRQTIRSLKMVKALVTLNY